MAGFAPSADAAAAALGGKNQIVQAYHPGGKKGVKFSLEEVCRRVFHARNDPRLVGWAGRVLIAAGKPKGVRAQMQAITDAIRKITMYVMDSSKTERTASPHVTLCLDEHGLCMPAGDCFPQGTLLLRDDFELVRIEDIKVGDKIWGKDAWTTIRNKVEKGTLSLDAIRLNNGSTVLLTGDHHVFGLVCKKHQDQLLGACNCRPAETAEYRIQVSDLQVGQVLTQPERIPFGNDTSLDPDRAYVEGLHVADGWHEEGTSRFSISGQDGQPKEAQKREVETICARIGVETRWNRKYIAINDAAWTDRIALMGRLAPNKHVLSMNLGEAQAAQTLRGVMADSGANTNGPGRTFSTTSHMLMVQVRVLHRMFGKSTSVRYMTAEQHQGLGQNPIWRVGIRSSGDKIDKRLRVKEIDRNALEMPCWDITTSDGYVYLPEHDVTVSNCDDLSVAGAGVAKALDFDVRIVGQAYDGSTIPTHVLFSVYDPDEKEWLDVDLSHESWPVGNSAVCSKDWRIDPMSSSITGLSGNDESGTFIGIAGLPDWFDVVISPRPQGLAQAATTATPTATPPANYVLGVNTVPSNAPTGSTVQEQPDSPYNTVCVKQADGTWQCSNGSSFAVGQLEHLASLTCPAGQTFVSPGLCVPPGGLKLGDGSTLMPDGSHHMADGSVITADGTYTSPNGTTVSPTGEVTLSAAAHIASSYEAAQQMVMHPFNTAAIGATAIGQGIGNVAGNYVAGIAQGVTNPTTTWLAAAAAAAAGIYLLAPIVKEVLATRQESRAERVQKRTEHAEKLAVKPAAAEHVRRRR